MLYEPTTLAPVVHETLMTAFNEAGLEDSWMVAVAVRWMEAEPEWRVIDVMERLGFGRKGFDRHCRARGYPTPGELRRMVRALRAHHAYTEERMSWEEASALIGACAPGMSGSLLDLAGSRPGELKLTPTAEVAGTMVRRALRWAS